MSIVADEIGIDVSKDSLVVSNAGGKPRAHANTLEGIGHLADGLPPSAVVHLESTGGYERLARRELARRGFQVRTLDPLRVRRLAQAQGRKAKTDPIDAQHLSVSGGLLPAAAPRTDEHEGILDHSRALQNLKKTLAGYRKRLGVPGLDPRAQDMYNELIATLVPLVKTAEAELQERIEASGLAQTYRLVLSVSGIGPVTACVLACELPTNIKERTPNQIAAYAGTAPIDQSSGKRHGTAKVGRGNSRIKGALYMGAISAISNQPWAKTLYHNMMERGRHPLQAIVAIERRLLTRAVIVIQRGTPWQKTRPEA